MATQIILIVVLVAIALLALYLRTLVKSTVQESVKDQFEVEWQNMRQEFEREVEARQRRDKFRLAALDARLAAYQEAFALARQMIRTLHDDEDIRHKVSIECDAFWDSKSLYLGSKARLAFRDAWSSYMSYFMLKEAHRKAAHSSQNKEYINEARNDLLKAFKKVSGLPGIVEQDIDLEAMGEEIFSLEGKRITPLGIEDKDQNHS